MIAILKYNAGNVTSVSNAIKSLGYDSIITDDEKIIRSADKVIFPGVGEASSAMSHLKERKLDQVVSSLDQPVLGICLGMQLMCAFSEENNTPGLGIFDVEVKKFPAREIVPHMGWNNFSWVKGSLFKQLNKDDNFYFVHNYYAELSEDTLAETNYILPFSAALHKENFYATQFHPEKSAKVGMQLLKNFLSL